MDKYEDVTGNELRARIDQLGLYYTHAARLLGLSLSGLQHQMRDERSVSAQTAIILERIEAEHAAQDEPPPPISRRGRRKPVGGAT